METYIFKTTFKCQSCIEAVKPILQQYEPIQWSIFEKENGTKYLKIEGENIDIHSIIESIQKLGYTLEWQA
ncbi:MAG: heavy-metal-associated domain-containing protein [Bacteroidia bacterium]|nr:heavy-metal-associated domain-containing protein [Bacteroidia bacterium]MDW8158870.1 heavy-metal-associated domain-containing protein [Bacteroidia bacterium]